MLLGARTRERYLGYLNVTPRQGAEHERQVLQDCVEQAVYAQQMGFDRIWAVEHHALRWYATKHCRSRRAVVSRFFASRYSDGHYFAIVDAVPWRSFGLNGWCAGFVATAGRRAAT